MFDNYTDRARSALSASQEILQRYRQNQLDGEHILLALLEQKESPVREILDRIGAETAGIVRRLEEELARTPRIYTADRANDSQVYITPRGKRILDLADSEARRLKDEYVGVEHLFLALIKEGDGPASRCLQTYRVNEEKVYRTLQLLRGGQKTPDDAGSQRFQGLSKYARDLTALARQGRLDPVIGRDEEITRVIQILSRRTKNNPVLIGDPGVGKTAIVEGLAQKIARGDVPETLRGRSLLSLDLAALVAGAKFRGEFEERLKGVMDEIRQAAGKIVLFIDELHSVVGAGAAEGAMDASAMLKPALSRGELQTIGATTLDEYRSHIEKDAALERRFQSILVGEPTAADAVEILKGLRDRYEAHHCVQITDAALESAVLLSTRYLTDRFLPDKAIDLVDEAASRVRITLSSMPLELKDLEAQLNHLVTEGTAAVDARDYERAARLQKEEQALREAFIARRDAWHSDSGRSSVVDAEDIAEVVSKTTGIPVTRMLESEAQRLLHLEDTLHRRVIGQDVAIAAVAEAIRRSRAGLADPRRPIGSFLFLGPTGVGKTELARALAEVLFDDESAMVRVDMSEYMEKHSVARLIGAPPGYVGYEEGGQLSDAVRRRPYRVVLLDEVEKAHPDIFNVLLQVLDDGRLTDGQGRVVNFKNAVIIMTSNIGSHLIDPMPEASTPAEQSLHYRRMQDSVMDELRRHLRPELLNRIDETVVFHALSREQITQIVRLMLHRTETALRERGMRLVVTDAACRTLVDHGYDPLYGARPLRRAIQRMLESPISSGILRREFRPGDTIVADVGPDTGMVFQRLTKQQQPG